MVRLLMDQRKITNRALITLERISRNPDGMSWEEMLHFLSLYVVGDDDVPLSKEDGFEALLDMTQAETLEAMQEFASSVEALKTDAVPPTNGVVSLSG